MKNKQIIAYLESIGFMRQDSKDENVYSKDYGVAQILINVDNKQISRTTDLFNK
jgi:hypothetical protein